jgi:hypothetical protein
VIRGLVRSALGRKGLGYRKDPEDSRDFRMGALLGALEDSPPPASASVAHPLVGPKDQRGSSACVGFSWSIALRLSFLREGVNCPDLSPLFLYFAARGEHGDQGVDAGSYLRAGGAAATKYGASDEASWAFSMLRVNKSPSFGAFRSAFDRRGRRGYFRVPSGNVDAVRRAIAAGHPVVGGWNIGASFLDWDGRGAIDQQRGEIVGGHAICLDSYTAEGTFSGPGSWGIGWGRSGRHVLTEALVRDGVDLWIVDV